METNWYEAALRYAEALAYEEDVYARLAEEARGKLQNGAGDVVGGDEED